MLFIIIMLVFPVCLAQDETEDMEGADDLEEVADEIAGYRKIA